MSFLIYLLSVVDNLLDASNILIALSIVAIVVSMGLTCGGKVNEEEWAIDGAKRIRRISIPVLIVAFLVAVFVPSSKTLAAMYLVPKIVNNEKVQDITGKAANVFELKLDEWIKDLSEEKGKE